MHEFILVIEGANKSLLDLEELEGQELSELRKQYLEIAILARGKLVKNQGRIHLMALTDENIPTYNQFIALAG